MIKTKFPKPNRQADFLDDILPGHERISNAPTFQELMDYANFNKLSHKEVLADEWRLRYKACRFEDKEHSSSKTSIWLCQNPALLTAQSNCNCIRAKNNETLRDMIRFRPKFMGYLTEFLKDKRSRADDWDSVKPSEIRQNLTGIGAASDNF